MNMLRLAAAAILTVGTLTSASAVEPREERGFGSNPGNLRMFSYVPASVARAGPLIVVLHGCKQNAVTFARDAGWLALADQLKLALLLPEQKGLPPYFHDAFVFPWVVTMMGANNQNACFNWFEPEHVTRDQGEALSIRQMVDTMMQRYSVDGARVYIVGFSAGAAMTAVMLAAYPERFAGGAIVAGVPFGCADNVMMALKCMNPGIDQSPDEWRRRVPRGVTGAHGRAPPVSIWHGSVDARVIPHNLQELVEQWTAVHGISAMPARHERNQFLRREVFTDGTSTRVESVLVKGLAHAFPIRTDGSTSCGQPGDFVASAGVCAAKEISRFWGLTEN